MRIGEILSEQDVALGLPARGRRSALTRIAAHLSNRAGLPSDSILAALRDRDRLGSTAIGRGVAVPHALLDGLRQPAAHLAVLERPIWFAAIDGKDVDIIITLLWPRSEARSFLPALSRVCRLFRIERLRRQLRVAVSADEALAILDHHTGMPTLTESPIAMTLHA